MNATTAALAVGTVGVGTVVACSNNKVQMAGGIAGVIGTVTGLALTILNLFAKGAKDTVELGAEKARQLVAAVIKALNSLLPGLGKLLEPLESFFDWLKKNAGSVAHVIVTVAGGYVVLKVIRR